MLKIIKLSFLICFALFLINSNAAPVKWRTLEPGIDYTIIHMPGESPFSKIHAFKINLNKFKLNLALTNKWHGLLTSLQSLAFSNQALIAINGGFFSPDLKPIGLRIANGKILSPLKKISWWGVFYIINNKAKIVSEKKFKVSKKISFAIQSGPRLIINGKIPNLKPGYANRSAIGITKDNQVIIVATQNFPISTLQLATIMRKTNKKGGLNCRWALNLDGGSSTQLFANINNFSLNIMSISPVTDAILVAPN